MSSYLNLTGTELLCPDMQALAIEPTKNFKEFINTLLDTDPLALYEELSDRAYNIALSCSLYDVSDDYSSRLPDGILISSKLSLAIISLIQEWAKAMNLKVIIINIQENDKVQ